MWWWILLVPATLLADALLDPDNRARIGETGPFGPYWLADKWDRFVAALEHERGGYRPKPSSLPKLPPPGTSGVPPRPGCYCTDRSVNPKTVRPPKSPTAVVPPRKIWTFEAEADAVLDILAKAGASEERIREFIDGGGLPSGPPPSSMVLVERSDPLWINLTHAADEPPDCKGRLRVPRAAYDAALARPRQLAEARAGTGCWPKARPPRACEPDDDREPPPPPPRYRSGG